MSLCCSHRRPLPPLPSPPLPITSARKLQVHAYTFRNEPFFLLPKLGGENVTDEFELAMWQLGLLDGAFADYPGTLAAWMASKPWGPPGSNASQPLRGGRGQGGSGKGDADVGGGEAAVRQAWDPSVVNLQPQGCKRHRGHAPVPAVAPGGAASRLAGMLAKGSRAVRLTERAGGPQSQRQQRPLLPASSGDKPAGSQEGVPQGTTAKVAPSGLGSPRAKAGTGPSQRPRGPGARAGVERNRRGLY